VGYIIHQPGTNKDYLVLVQDLKTLGDKARKSGNFVKAREYYSKALILLKKNPNSSPLHATLEKDLNAVLNKPEMRQVAKGYVLLDKKWVKKKDFLRQHRQRQYLERRAQKLLSLTENALKDSHYSEAAWNIYRILEIIEKEPWLKDRKDIVKDVLNKLGSFPKGVTTPLHVAIDRGSILIVKELLKYNVKLDKQNELGQTPLLLAGRNGNIELITLLLKHGASPNVTDVNGITPLHEAVRLNKKEAAKLLLAHGAKVNCKDKNALTPLFIALKAGNFDMIKILLEHGANPNVQDKNGITALEIAYFNGPYRKKLIKMLLAYGANPNQLKRVIQKAILPEAQRKAAAILDQIEADIDQAISRTGCLLIIDKETKRNLNKLIEEVSVFFDDIKKDGSNLKMVFISAITAFNHLASKYGSKTDVFEMYNSLVQLNKRYGNHYKFVISFHNGVPFIVLKDKKGNEIITDKLTQATPFVFNKYNYLVMLNFTELPGVVDIIAKRLVPAITEREFSSLVKDKK